MNEALKSESAKKTYPDSGSLPMNAVKAIDRKILREYSHHRLPSRLSARHRLGTTWRSPFGPHSVQIIWLGQLCTHVRPHGSRGCLNNRLNWPAPKRHLLPTRPHRRVFSPIATWRLTRVTLQPIDAHFSTRKTCAASGNRSAEREILISKIVKSARGY